MDRATRCKCLIEILLDNTARIDERDDAAMNLYKYDEPEALRGLLIAAKNSEDDSTILESCGESIASIWIRNNTLDKEIYQELNIEARHGILNVLEDSKPEWIDILKRDF